MSERIYILKDFVFGLKNNNVSFIHKVKFCLADYYFRNKPHTKELFYFRMARKSLLNVVKNIFSYSFTAEEVGILKGNIFINFWGN